MTTESNQRLIAVDMDDVLMQTNQTVCHWHNATYPSPIHMDTSQFYYYHYWKNPSWGTPAQTLEKVIQFYTSPNFGNAVPVEGAKDGVAELLKMGYKLVVVTARAESMRGVTEAWLNQHFPDMFESVYFTSEFKMTKCKGLKALGMNPGKEKILQSLGANLLIDDAYHNTLACGLVDPPIRAILFGNYQWNKRPSSMVTPQDGLSYEERSALEPEGSSWWTKDDVQELPAFVTRASGWCDVVRICKDNVV